jgi:integrase
MSREGMPIGEAMALTVHDIDWRGAILINKNVPAGICRLEDSTKTEPSDREIEFWSQDFRLALETMLKQRQKEWTAKGPIPEFLFCERSGHMINYSRFVKAWNHAQKMAGSQAEVPHSLRHCWANHRSPLERTSHRSRNTSDTQTPGVTLGIYTHFLPKNRRLVGTVLDRQKATERGYKVNPRSENPCKLLYLLEPAPGLEPGTY